MTLREWLYGNCVDNRTGQVSTTQTAYIGAFVAATYCVVWQTMHGTLTEWLLVAYLGAFVAGSLGSKTINATADVKKTNGPNPPAPVDAIAAAGGGD